MTKIISSQEGYAVKYTKDGKVVGWLKNHFQEVVIYDKTQAERTCLGLTGCTPHKVRVDVYDLTEGE